MRADWLLFGESQSRVVLSIARPDLAKLRDRALRDGIPLEVLGEVRGERLEIGDLVDLTLDEMVAVWSGGLERSLGVVG